MKQQIDELARDIYSIFRSETTSRAMASMLVEKGWSKQSEGEWIWKSNGYMKCLHCSCCGNQEEWETAYCPNCGAKMKGGAE